MVETGITFYLFERYFFFIVYRDSIFVLVKMEQILYFLLTDAAMNNES